MADYYIHNGANGSGSISSPYNALTNAPQGSDNRYFFKRGGTYPVINLNYLKWDRVTIGAWGPGSQRPIMSGYVTRPASDWTYESSTGTYWCTATLPADNSASVSSGHVRRGGVMLFCEVEERGATPGNMRANSSLLRRSQSRMYIKIDGSINDAPLELSHSRYGMATGIGRAATENYFFELVLQGCSVHGLILADSSYARIEDLDAIGMGGEWRSWAGYHLGNGFEFTAGTEGLRMKRCRARYMFDSGFSPQIYEGSAYTLQDQILQDVSAEECGLYGLEYSTQSANQTIQNITVERYLGRNVGGPDLGGGCTWVNSTNGSGYGIGFVGNSPSVGTSTLTNMLVRDATLIDCQGALLAFPKGVSTMEFENIHVKNTRRMNTGLSLVKHRTLDVKVRGFIVDNCNNAISESDHDGGYSGTVLLGNGLLRNCTTGINRASNITTTLRNTVVEGVNTLGGGSGGTLTGGYNRINGSSGSLGNYSLAGTDTRNQTALTYDSAIPHMLANGSAEYSGGATYSGVETSVDILGQQFGAGGVWAQGAYAKYNSSGSPVPSPPPAPEPPAPPPPGPAPTPAPGAAVGDWGESSDDVTAQVFWISGTTPAPGPAPGPGPSPTPTPVVPTVSTTSPLPTGTVGVAYSVQLEATGPTPYTWSAGGVPQGLSLSAAGLLSGTPVVAGGYSLSVTCANNDGPSTAKVLSLTINPAAGVTVAGANWSFKLGRN